VSQPLYSFYGDDFTGSTDVLEGLSTAGIRSVLFLGAPAPKHFGQFNDCQAFGIAGDSRSRPPQWMDENLPAIFERLRSFGAPVVHYKTCSTFDSSPRMGSIGRAMEIGLRTSQSAFVPVVVAAPHLRRYVVFGNLFAAAGSDVYRIDRHPTMSRHPVTPMHEADLRSHLAAQTPMRVGLIDLPTLQGGRADEMLSARLKAGDKAVVFDGVERYETDEVGRILWRLARKAPLFAVGSSGLTYGLASAWKAESAIAETNTVSRARAADRLLVMSGSCSPVTERQIAHALRNGYEGIALDVGAFTTRDVVSKVTRALQHTGKVVVYTSLGPLSAGTTARGDALGQAIGSMLREIIQTTGVRRVVLAGGDTSSHAVAQLGLYALTWAAATEPGAPLCHAHSDTPTLDGLELVLKGGQVGGADFFERVRLGSA
jgi:3-oxoisoapionate kinase